MIDEVQIELLIESSFMMSQIQWFDVFVAVRRQTCYITEWILLENAANILMFDSRNIL